MPEQLSAASLADGIIEPDSPGGRQVGFTSDLFAGWLWKIGPDLWISFIISKTPGQGHFGVLLACLRQYGLRIIVPTPSRTMEAILLARGATQLDIDVGLDEPCQCLVLAPLE